MAQWATDTALQKQRALCKNPLLQHVMDLLTLDHSGSQTETREEARNLIISFPRGINNILFYL